MKSKTFVKPNYLLSVIAFILLLFFSIVSQKFECSGAADYLSCNVNVTTAENIDLSYDIRKFREDGDLVNHIELHIPSGTQLHVCGVFSDGTVDVDDISMDIDLDQESIQLLDDHPVRSHGDSLIEKTQCLRASCFGEKSM